MKKFSIYSPLALILGSLSLVLAADVAFADLKSCIGDVAAVFNCLGKEEPFPQLARIAFALITLFVAMDQKDKIFGGESAAEVAKALVKIAIPAVMAYAWTEIMTKLATLFAGG